MPYKIALTEDSERQLQALPADDSMMDELLASNPRFQELVAKSKASPRKPFRGGGRVLTNGR